MHSTPEEQGIDSSVLVEAFEFLEHEGKDLHSLLVARHGHVVVEAYTPPYGPAEKHMLNSCTKTVLSALVGVAVDRGLVHEDDSVVEHFPDYVQADVDERKRRITVKHLLTMSSGISWPQFGRTNVSDEMGRSADWVRFILDRPMAAEPGTQTNYSNGDSHLMSVILERATGGSALDFAREALFDPLGIHDVRWGCDPQGRNIGSAAMYLLPVDMAKLGWLYLQRGIWGDRRIVSRRWVEASLQPYVEMPTSGGDAGYGYYWWIYPERALYEAWGGQGQRIGLLPALDMVVVMTADIGDDEPRSRFAANVYEHVCRAAVSTNPLPANPAAMKRLEQLVCLSPAARAAETDLTNMDMSH